MTERELIEALSPIQRVALTLWGEARGSSPQLRAGIASAILNRVTAQRVGWGLTADDVCLKRKQFSCWNDSPGDTNHFMVIDAARNLIRGDGVGPILRECLGLAIKVCEGTHPDRVKQATHYYSPDAMVPKGRIPYWAVGHDPTVIIDSTRFFKGIA